MTSLERLPQLYAMLRSNQFVVTIDRWQSFSDLLIKLKLDNRFPQSSRELGQLACPLFTSNAHEQALFWKVFDAWDSTQEWQKPNKDVSVAQQQEQNHKQYSKKAARGPWLSLVVMVLFGCAFAASYMLYPVASAPPLDEVVNSTTGGGEGTDIPKQPDSPMVNLEGVELQPIPPRELPAQVTIEVDVSEYYVLVYSLPGLVLLIGVIWFLFRNRRRKLILRAQRGRRDDPLINLFMQEDYPTVFHLDDRGSSFRRGVSWETHSLDPEGTVNATIRNAGLFTGVAKKRFRQPDYLILMDYRFRQDHATQFFHVFLDKLKHKQQVKLHLFEYRGDPSVVFPLEGLQSKPVKLQNLSHQYPNARLIITGTAEEVTSRLYGVQQVNTEAFSHWQTRIWFTPRPQPWGDRERALQKAGFAVAPLTSQGVEDVLDWLQKPDAPGGQVSEHVYDRYPRLLQMNESEWLRERPPARYQFESFQKALLDYLGPRGMELLVACAVYPQLHSELTYALEKRLFPYDSPDRVERRLLKLARLPWFRYDRMPSYLRRDLIAHQDKKQMEKIGNIYRDIFKRVVGVSSQDKKKEKKRIYQPLQVQSKQDKKFLQYIKDWVRFSESGSVMSDQYFAQVLLSAKVGMLDFMVPDTLRRWLPKPSNRYGIPITAIVLASALWWGGDWIWNNSPIQDQLVENARSLKVLENQQYSIAIIHTNETHILAKRLEYILNQHGYKVYLYYDEAAPESYLNPVGAPSESYSELAEEVKDNRLFYRKEYRQVAALVQRQFEYFTYSISPLKLVSVDEVYAGSEEELLIPDSMVLYLLETMPAGGLFYDELRYSYDAKPASSPSAGVPE